MTEQRRVIDAWMQHPVRRWIDDEIFASLRRWKPGPFSETAPPLKVTVETMDTARTSSRATPLRPRDLHDRRRHQRAARLGALAGPTVPRREPATAPRNPPALIDTGFVGHADQTHDWAEAQAGGRIEVVVNTHWHADHVGGNAALQATGAAIAASAPDADAVQRRDPGCCVAEYLDQPVAPYTVEQALTDQQTVHLGETEWQVIATPGHTPGHLCLWQPDEQLLVVGDALSDYDVGWVATALDGPDATATAVASLERLDELHPRVIIPHTARSPPTPQRRSRTPTVGRNAWSTTPTARSGTAHGGSSPTPS